MFFYCLSIIIYYLTVIKQKKIKYLFYMLCFSNFVLDLINIIYYEKYKNSADRNTRWHYNF